jgi:hypothetical protein
VALYTSEIDVRVPATSWIEASASVTGTCVKPTVAEQPSATDWASVPKIRQKSSSDGSSLHRGDGERVIQPRTY